MAFIGVLFIIIVSSSLCDRAKNLRLVLTPQQAPRYRVMAILWYGSYYQTGLVMEIMGEDVQNYMMQKTAELIRYFDNEVPIAVRTLHSRLYTD